MNIRKHIMSEEAYREYPHHTEQDTPKKPSIKDKFKQFVEDVNANAQARKELWLSKRKLKKAKKSYNKELKKEESNMTGKEEIVSETEDEQVEEDSEAADDQDDQEQTKGKSGKKKAGKNQMLVMKELPTQQVNQLEAKDGKTYDLMTIEEALTFLVNKAKEK